MLDDPNYAKMTYEHLRQDIEKAQRELSAGEQLDVYYYPGTQGAAIRVENIGYWNPYMLRLYGKDEEGRSSLVLGHMNAIALVLKWRELKPKEKRKPIGFAPPPDEKARGRGSA